MSLNKHRKQSHAITGPLSDLLVARGQYNFNQVVGEPIQHEKSNMFRHAYIVPSHKKLKQTPKSFRKTQKEKDIDINHFVGVLELVKPTSPTMLV